MKVKILSAVLLLVCFCALGVLSGVIPTHTGDGAPPEAAAVTASPAPEATSAVLPYPADPAAPAGAGPGQEGLLPPAGDPAPGGADGHAGAHG